jgi:hypothetical protein
MSNVIKISYEEAKNKFKECTVGIYCELTNSIKALVGEEQLLSVIFRNEAYTLTHTDSWDLDIVFNVESEAYIKGKAYFTDCKNLDKYRDISK